MALGVPGTGPYGETRKLRRLIKDCEYEISLITQGMRRQLSKKQYEQMILANQAEIKKIMQRVKRPSKRK